MISPSFASYLRNTPPEVLLDRHAEYACNHFESGRESESVQHVVIAARQEEDDIVATLLSLSRSSVPVDAIVVVNGSDDATAERARAAGA